MTTEIAGTLETPPPAKTFTETEVEELMRKRHERTNENLRLQHEENKRLKSKLEELESKTQKGTATVDDMQQLEAAKTAATQSQAQGLSPEQMQRMVEMGMQHKELENKLIEANQKDPEFARLLKEGNKLSLEEVVETAYLPNAPAVIKQLMKDKKAFALFKASQMEGPVSMMTVLNNLSDKLESTAEKPAASQYKPAEPLSDASDEDQNFDEGDYIKGKY